jgi:uncharacterized protein YbbC (DUF1343 family)
MTQKIKQLIKHNPIFKNTYFFWVLILIFSIGCKTKTPILYNPQIIDNNIPTEIYKKSDVVVAASRISKYLPLLSQKKVGIIANQGSVIYNSKNQKQIHLIDTLLSLNVNIVKVFSPEHGFRGTADAGELVQDEIDIQTGLKLVSLYGSNKKPKPDQLAGIDILIFDLQDVGVRFYTYISTLHYVMEAAAEQKIPLIVLDRPNPNAHYIDGPVLDLTFKSFVGMHPVPVVYGMTIGEYAKMINGEKWLEKGIQCQLNVIEILHYNHKSKYVLPIKPSPNLPNAKSINLYPSLCFFEGTAMSCGRGTDKQFQIFGSPLLPENIYAYQFIPLPNEGTKQPLFQGEICNGSNLEMQHKLNHLNLKWLQDSYMNHPDQTNFFNDYFNTLAGNNQLKTQITSGISMDEIRKTWQPQLEIFKKIRSKYLLYP